MSDGARTAAPPRLHASSLLGTPSDKSAASTPSSTSELSVLPARSPTASSGLTSPSGPTSMSHSDVRIHAAGLDLLRTQVLTLQNENEELKRGLVQLEREKAADTKRIRMLLGRSMVRHHCQSFKLRRMLVHLHTQVLEVAEVLNKEQQISDAQSNTHISVQEDANGGNNNDDAVQLYLGSEQLALQQKAAFLMSLGKLRPSRAGRALQENLERLFENVRAVVERAPKYRSDLSWQFARNVELKQTLLDQQQEHQQAQERYAAMQQELQSLAEQTEAYRHRNEELARDMRLTLDLEKRRRLRENAQQIAARTKLYKKLLADKDNPLNPAQLAAKGKPGTNVLMALDAQLRQQELADPNSKASQQLRYYEERRLAQEQAQAQAEQQAEQEAQAQAAQDEAAYQQLLEQQQAQAAEASDSDALSASPPPPSEAPLSPEELAARALAAQLADREKYRYPSDGLGFQGRKIDPLDPLGRSEDLAGYRFRAGEETPRRQVEEDESKTSSSSPTLPPITNKVSASPSSSKLSLGYYPALKLKQNTSYAANERAFAAYAHSHEWMRQQAAIAASQRAAAVAAAAAAAAHSAATADGSPPPKGKHHHSSSYHTHSAFPSAQRIYPHRVGVGGNRENDSPPPAGGRVDHAQAEWVDNFGMAQQMAAQQHAAAAAGHASTSNSSAIHSPQHAPQQLPRISAASPMRGVPSPKAKHVSHAGVRSPSPFSSSSGSAAGAPATPASAAPAPDFSSSTPEQATATSSVHVDPVDGTRTEVVVSTTTLSSSMFKFAQQAPSPAMAQAAAGGGAGNVGGFASSGGTAGAFKPHARGASMSRRAPSMSPSGSLKKLAPSGDSASEVPLHLRTIPASPRRDGGLF